MNKPTVLGYGVTVQFGEHTQFVRNFHTGAKARCDCGCCATAYQMVDCQCMTAENALRFAANQARRCRDRDSAESLCLLFPALLKVLKLEPMDDLQALDFRLELRAALKEKPL